MVNSGSFDSDVDRNEKGEFTQPRRIAESPQSASSVHAVTGSLCENDFSTQTADSLPPASQAIEPTATKTEYKCSMSDLFSRARKILTKQCDLGDSASRPNNDVYYTHETSIVAEGYPTEIGKSVETALLAPKEEEVTKCNKVLNKDDGIKKVSVCCSVPLEKVQNILNACRTSTEKIGVRKQISKKDMCLYCDRTFVTSTLKQKHVDRYHSLKYNRRLSTRRQVAKHSVTACIFCDKLNNVECSLKQLFEHLVTEHPKKYFGCLDCEIRFPNFQIFDNHNIKIHGASKEPISEQKEEKNEDIVKKNIIEKLDNYLGPKLENEEKSLESKSPEEEKNSSLVNNVLDDEEKSKEKNKNRSKRLNGTKKKEEEKLKQSLPTLSVTLEPLKVFPNEKVTVSNENFFVKDKSKINWVKELRSKKVSVVSTKMGIKQCLRITRQQNKTLENVKNSKRKVRNTKTEHNKTSINTKYLSFQNHPYTTFDVSFRVKKITDHSIDNIKISSLTFDDVFDKAFFNRVKCNIQENLLNFVDGKLFKSVESENRISSFQKSSNLQLDEPSQNYGCKLSTNVVSPVTTSLLTEAQVGEDVESQSEPLKPSKKKGTAAVVNDEVHYKYFTRRKYQAVISENKQHRDLSKLDMWTQLIVKNRQQKIMTEQKTDKEIIEYKKSEEYKVKMQVEELDRILDKRGPLEDLKEEAIRTVALEKLNGTAVDSSNIESYFDVTIILNQLLNSVFTTDPSSLEITREDIDNKSISPDNSNNSTSEISQVGEEIPTMLNLRRISYPPQEDSSQTLPNNEIDKTVMMELTGEWARSRIYVCAACGIKMPNTKVLIDHKNLFHEHVWCQHYEFVGNQGELYRHLSIPGLGKVGEIESSGSKMWRRSDARVCSKCNKQFNCLGDLHRHVLECGGDWSWMLARKKYKYRPYGSKPRKRRRGLLKFLHTFRERKEQSREKGKPIKKFDGPRQKPSDADTIERMLANLPAKRTTRKIISLKDGLQRSIKNPNISKPINKNKSLKQNKIQVNKTPQKNKDPIKSSKKSRRLLRSNSNIIFENQMNLILPKYKKERKDTQSDNKSNIRRHSVRNISRVLSNKLVKANQPALKTKINDNTQNKIIKSSKGAVDGIDTKEDDNESNKNEENNLTFKKPKKKNVEAGLILKNSGKTSPKIGAEKKTDADPSKKKCVKKGKLTANELTKSSLLTLEDQSVNVQNAEDITSCFNKEEEKKDLSLSQPIKDIVKGKMKIRSSKGTFIKKSASLGNIEEGTSFGSLKPQLNSASLSTLDLASKPLNFFKSIKKKKKSSVNKELAIPETSKIDNNIPNEGRKNKKNKFAFNLRKSKVQHEQKNLETNTHRRKKNNVRSKGVIHTLNSASKKIKKTITKIIQVDGSSQNKPSTRSKRFKKEFPQGDFLCLNSKLSQSPPTTTADEVIKIIPENNPEIFQDPKVQLLENFSEVISFPVSNKESVINVDCSTDVENTTLVESNIESSTLQELVETKTNNPDTNKLSTSNPITKKRINKKQRGLNDCIAMLTNKLQDKSLTVQNNEPTFCSPEELPNNLTLTNSNKFPLKLEEEKNDLEKPENSLDKLDNVDSLKPFIGCKNNKENFDSNSQQNSGILTETSFLINSPSCFWEKLDKPRVDQVNSKYTPKDEMAYENALLLNCITQSCPDSKCDKEPNSEPNYQQKLTPPSSVDTTTNLNHLEFSKDDQSSVLQFLEQYPLLDDNRKKDAVENVNASSKVKSDDLKQTNNEMGIFHDFGLNGGLERVPVYRTENKNLKIRQRKIKHKKKNFHTKLQNSRKSLRSRYGDYSNKQENIKGNEFSNTIIEINHSEVVKDNLATTKLIENLTENEQPVVLSTSEEFSNIGKENIKSNKGIKHRRTKHSKGLNKKKNNVCETLLVNKSVEDDVFKQIPLDVSTENQTILPEISGFVDSDDDVPLAAFLKKSVDCNNTNIENSLACESFEKSLLIPNEIQDGLPILSEKEVISSEVNQENGSQKAALNIFPIPQREMISNENYFPKEAKLSEKESYGQVLVKTAGKGRKKSSKLVTTDKKITRRKKQNSKNKTDLKDASNTTPKLFFENDVPIDFSNQEKCYVQDNESFSKITTLDNLANHFVSPSDSNPEAINLEQQIKSKENYFLLIDQTIEDVILNNLQENSTDSCSTLNKATEEFKMQESSTVEPLNIGEENGTVENLTSQEEGGQILDAVVTNTKSKSRPRLKTVFNNKRNVNGKKKFKPENLNVSSNIFCEICKKTFTRSENLLKHKRTLTHIAKLSELEALQAAEKLKQENKRPSHTVDDILEDKLNPEDADVDVLTSEFDEFPKNTEINTFGLASSQESLKLVDIISDVLSKPIDDEFVKPSSFSGLILQSDHETKRCKSLGERKSFDSDKLLFTNQTSPTHDLNQKFVGSKLSNTADIIVEKQISLLENMIEDNRNFKASDSIFSSSHTNEEYSNHSNSSEFSLLSSSKPEEGNDITFTHNTNIITNLIKPTLTEDNLMHSTQYEEISEDSSSSHFQVEEQKSRKALNRDEELFLECCSLLKSSSDISDLCKKPVKSAQFLNNFGLKPLDEFEWLEQKQLPTKKTADFEYISNNFISDDSRMNVSVSDNFYNDLSYSNSNMSNSNLNLKVLLDQNVNDQLFSQPPPIFEDISTESEESSGKSLGNCLKTISSAIVLNEQDVVYDKIKIKDQLSPSVESAQIPEEHENLNERVENAMKFGDGKSKAEKNKINVNLHKSQDIAYPVPKTTQASIIDYAVPSKIKKHQSKKMLTKGAMKVFEGLKVSIPKDGIDMKEVLSCSPTSKRLQLEAEEENSSVNKKLLNEKLIKQNSNFNKIINNTQSIKKIGNRLGLKITKKKYLSNKKGSVKIKVNNMTTQNENKSHDIYDFEETQDIVDTFTSSSNSLPNYRSFRNKLADKVSDNCKNTKKKSDFHDFENKTDDEESQGFKDPQNNRNVNEKESPAMEPPSKKIEMCKSITKKKCMIMGRIFKNAVKSKIGEEIKNIPAIENAKIVEDFVLNCQTIQPESEIDKEHKLSEEEMNTIFDNLLKEEKSDKKNEETNESGSNTVIVSKNIDHKPKHKINRCKKRHRANSSDFSDEEFSIKKVPKRNVGKKNSKNNECVINLEQELKECIGVASRKSQRKCTSGKQNVLVEYWSSDESSFETDHNIGVPNYLQNIAPKLEECPSTVVVNQRIEIENKSSTSSLITENERKDFEELLDLPHEKQTSIVDVSIKKKIKEVGNKQSRKLINPHNGNKLLKTSKNGDTSSSSFEVIDSQTIASCRRKRTAVDTLYYWSSSSEDELQDIIEVKPVREEYDDEERPLQHGWIVGDSPKKLVTMLAQAKGKKLDVECVKKNKKKRTGV